MFARDRDLLMLEPALPREVDWVGQRLLDAGSGVVSAGGTALLLTGISGLAALSIASGQLIRVDGVWGEIVSAIEPNLLTISRLRADADAPAIPLSVGGATPSDVRVISFGAQIGGVHAALMESLGLGDDGLDEVAVLDGALMARIEALGALGIVYSGAASMVGGGGDGMRDAMGLKGAMYRERFEQQRRTLSVRIDTDGDGEADEMRSLRGARLDRAQRMRRA
ncbi:MAG: hypothetical protein ACTS3F_01085 [Phycisphaerales bacterium]